MASHPEQLRVQLEDAIASSIPYNHYYLIDTEIDIELLNVIQGKGSSHYIALFYTTGKDLSAIREVLEDARSEMMDNIAATITRKRIPNITFQVTNIYPTTKVEGPDGSET